MHGHGKSIERLHICRRQVPRLSAASDSQGTRRHRRHLPGAHAVSPLIMKARQRDNAEHAFHMAWCYVAHRAGQGPGGEVRRMQH